MCEQYNSSGYVITRQSTVDDVSAWHEDAWSSSSFVGAAAVDVGSARCAESHHEATNTNTANVCAVVISRYNVSVTDNVRSEPLDGHACGSRRR